MYSLGSAGSARVVGIFLALLLFLLLPGEVEDTPLVVSEEPGIYSVVTITGSSGGLVSVSTSIASAGTLSESASGGT